MKAHGDKNVKVTGLKNEGLIKILKIKGEENPADGFTKAVKILRNLN